MEIRILTIKCINLVYDALTDIFQYKNNSYELLTCVEGIFYAT